jgi:type II secretory pathway pseudopilin PulG
LIELLVVIAVISVLMAVLLPSLSAARQLAKNMKCGSNLHQIAIAWQQYVGDSSDGRFYQCVNANLRYGGWRGYMKWTPRPLNPYVSLPVDANEADADIFRCPRDKGGVPGDYFLDTAYQCNGASYQTNIFVIGQMRCGKFSDRTESLDMQISERLANMSVGRITSDWSRLLLVGDYGWINQWMPRPYATPEEKTQTEWHGKPERYMMAFLDCHVRPVTIRKGVYVADDYTVIPFKDLSDPNE